MCSYCTTSTFKRETIIDLSFNCWDALSCIIRIKSMTLGAFGACVMFSKLFQVVIVCSVFQQSVFIPNYAYDRNFVRLPNTNRIMPSYDDEFDDDKRPVSFFRNKNHVTKTASFCVI